MTSRRSSQDTAMLDMTCDVEKLIEDRLDDFTVF
jgi:hypothetical protein